MAGQSRERNEVLVSGRSRSGRRGARTPRPIDGSLPAFRAEHPELARPIGPDPPFVGDTLVGARSAAAVAATGSSLREGGVRPRRRLAGHAGDRDAEDAWLGRAFAASLEHAVERCGPEVAKAHQPTVLSRGFPRQASPRQSIPEADFCRIGRMHFRKDLIAVVAAAVFRRDRRRQRRLGCSSALRGPRAEADPDGCAGGLRGRPGAAGWLDPRIRPLLDARIECRRDDVPEHPCLPDGGRREGKRELSLPRLRPREDDGAGSLEREAAARSRSAGGTQQESRSSRAAGT